MTPRRCAWAAALLAVACRAPTATAPPPAAAIDLLARFPDVDCRSDTLDLPFLLSRSLLKHGGWEEVLDPVKKTAWLWLAGTDARLDLPLRTTGPKTLRLTARCKVSQRPQLPVTVSLNGHVLATLAVTPDEAEHRIEVPAAAQRPGRNELHFQARPKEERARRPLMLTRLEIGPEGEPAGEPPLRSAEGLRLGPGAALRYPVHVPGPGAELEVALRDGGSGAGHVRVALEGGGGERELATVGGGEERPARVPLPPGPVARLTLTSSGVAWIRTLRLRLPVPPPPASTPASPAAGAVSRPNLVIYVADAVRADVLSAYGYPLPTSPRFDAFARTGWLFEDATAQSAWTRPSAASLLTGLGVDGHGVIGTANAIVPALTTLPEALHAAGYATAAFVANDVVSPSLGYAQGFDTWSAFARRPSAEVVRGALAWIRDRRGPFLVYVHTLGAHRPYAPPREHWRPFLPVPLPRRRDVNALVLQARLAPEEQALVRSAYAAEVHEDDAAFGELLDGLQARGPGERTAIAYTADHGEAFDEHGQRGHGAGLYQETARVPLALRLPGAAAGTRIAQPVQHVDVAPTFLALAGVPRPPELLGRDLRLLAASGARATDPARLLISRLTYAGADKVAVRWGTLKLIANEERDAPPDRRFELYDLARDPGEAEDLSRGRPEVVEYLWAESRALRAVEEAFRARVGAGRKVQLSPADREALRALGYVE